MIEETLRKMNELRLYAMIEKIRYLIDSEKIATLNGDDLLAFIVDAEFDKRKQNRIERIIRQSSLKISGACIADIEFSARRNLYKDHLGQVVSGDFLSQKKNVLISGATGCGKTYMACALGNLAC